MMVEQGYAHGKFGKLGILGWKTPSSTPGMLLALIVTQKHSLHKLFACYHHLYPNANASASNGHTMGDRNAIPDSMRIDPWGF